MRKRPVLLVAAATAVAGGVAAALVAAAVIYGGLYDVAASTQHFQPVYSVLQKAMRQSVKLRARDIEAPPLADERMALRGAGCFRDKCVQCHGAPGVAQHDIGQAMQPLPGPLVDARRHWKPRELYWVTRHGIRMSGMPAWEFQLRDEDIWAVVAFMQRLPDLNAPQYADWARRAPACRADEGAPLQASMPVDPERGRQALHQHACVACHTIPGVVGAQARVGPPLEEMGRRQLIAGVLANTPGNMAQWLMRTQQVKPGTAMPELGVTERDARDMAAYLATLK